MSDIRKYKRVQTREALEQVLKTEPSETQFDAYLDQLDDFVAAQLAGEEYETQFPDMVAYLNTDVRLADAYNRLYKLEIDALSDKIRMAPSIRKENPNFLDKLLKMLLGGSIEYPPGAIAMLFTPDILSRLHVEPVLGGGALKALEAKTVLYKLDPEEHGLSDWPATITVLSGDEAELCTVQVQVTPPGRAFPNLSGTEVSIEIPGLEPYEQKTDMLGVATFENIEIEQLSQIRVVIQE